MPCAAFVPASSGMVWGGMICRTCGDKNSDHAEGARKPAGGAKVKAAEAAEPKKEKKQNRHAGTQPGSLAFFVGDALGIKHKGEHTGLTRQSEQAGVDEIAYHQNKSANKEMAQAFGAMFMAASKGADGKVLTASQVIKQEKLLIAEKSKGGSGARPAKAEAKAEAKGEEDDEPVEEVEVLEDDGAAAAAAEKATAEKAAAEKAAAERKAEQAKKAKDKAEADAKAKAAEEGGAAKVCNRFELDLEHPHMACVCGKPKNEHPS